ncbi:heavy metal transporter [Acinetobacter wanghuae]|uniref:Heavy metal transporter n=1 Tax=Acinetobacter wanghuae TaxID=2662362 RepID=A0A5Q0P2V8_9GAMM|nr:heavy-metal-associated domain-containing protein [Acinetobacter wanghuae]MQW92564.1 heavy metal transporter [Acinetobacter wanghuae]QGA11096.1 heavy metal transporter [Acinetobacter wanghuae]
MKLRIDNMTCGGCARSVTATIKELDQNAVVTIDVATKLVDVETQISQDDVIAALTEDGFPPVTA